MFKKVLGGMLFVGLFLLFTTVPSVAKKRTVWDIYPVMTLELIQSYVTNASDGDTIYFHAGTYDWSGAPVQPGIASVGAINIIDKTLTIQGETGNLIIGPDSYTDIENIPRGLNAFQVLDEDTNNDVTFIGLNIQHFRRGIAVAHNIWTPPNTFLYDVWNARNVTIKNCAISDMAGQAIAISNPAGNVSIENNILSQTGRMAIWFTYRGPNFNSYSQPDKSKVNISGNTITSAAQGLYAERTKNFRVENNSISMPDSSFGNWGIGFGGAKSGTVISANSISNYRYGIYGEAWSLDGDVWTDNYPAEKMIIDKNKVSFASPITNWCYGISLDGPFSSGHTVTGNEIDVTSINGVGIYSEVNHSFYGKNKISGSGWHAIELNGWDYSGGTGLPAYAHDEEFQNNDVSQFTPSEGHCYLENVTHDNTIVGSGKSPWTYIDHGMNNLIIGGTNITSLTLQALSDESAVRPKPGEGLRDAKKNIKF